jgi:hypothetical protein
LSIFYAQASGLTLKIGQCQQAFINYGQFSDKYGIYHYNQFFMSAFHSIEKKGVFGHFSKKNIWFENLNGNGNFGLNPFFGDIHKFFKIILNV